MIEWALIISAFGVVGVAAIILVLWFLHATSVPRGQHVLKENEMPDHEPYDEYRPKGEQQ